VMITASQKTSTTKNRVGMTLPICCKNSERVRPVGELQGAAHGWPSVGSHPR
jgi:hypothetical protein